MKVALFSQVSSNLGWPQLLGSLLRRKGEVILQIAPQAQGLHFASAAAWMSERIKRDEVVKKMSF